MVIRIVVPLAEFGRFVDNLERIYTGQVGGDEKTSLRVTASFEQHGRQGFYSCSAEHSGPTDPAALVKRVLGSAEPVARVAINPDRLVQVAKAAAAMPADRIIMQVNSARNLLEVASQDLRGEIAAAQGHFDAAIAALRRAVELQDALRYMEPPAWYFPERQALGAVLLRARRAAEAEHVYREDLVRNPENAWALVGLAQSLRVQKKHREAGQAQARFAEASARADVLISTSRL